MAQNINDYSGYELYDFLMDQDFKHWALGNDDNANSYWLAVMKRYPEKKQIILEARKIVFSLNKRNTDSHQKNAAASDRKKVLWESIENEIEEKTADQPAVKQISIRNLYRYSVAAMVIIGFSIAFWLNQDARQVSVMTGNGESKTVVLPDSSTVELAANSSITYSKNVNEENLREVYVTGEAWFKVRHLNKNPSHIIAKERFVVHLQHAFDVEVLGTVFSVNDRRGKAVVNLESGSVKIITPENQLLLTPGQSAVMAQQKVTVVKTERLAKATHIWHTNILLMDKTAVKEVIAVLEDNYGIKINVAAKAVLERQLDGSIPLNDEHKALLILKSITGTQSNRQMNTITLTPN